MTTIANNLQAAARAKVPGIKCRITPVLRLVRIDYGDRTRVVRVSTAARILAALRAGNVDPLETLRTVK